MIRALIVSLALVLAGPVLAAPLAKDLFGAQTVATGV